MFTLDPRRISPQVASGALATYRAVQDWTTPAVLARDLNRPQGTFHLLVPSTSHSGQWYEVRVIVGRLYWSGAHYGRPCEAGDANRACRHLWAAALWVATYARGGVYEGKIPVPAVAPLRPAGEKPVPRQPTSPAAVAGFYD